MPDRVSPPIGYEIIHGQEHADFAQERITVSVAELADERQAVAGLSLLGPRNLL
ncbi:hypothetical protein [Rothia nasimurium]|uniref:hypothetical protein n=1 Tax=Rothia nasimurium TaxID=85336 RepID=UPI003BA03AB8